MRRKPGILPPRQMQCATLAARGHDDLGIARHMGVAHHSVRAYLNLIYRRLGLQDWGNPRVRLANWVYGRGAREEVAREVDK